MASYEQVMTWINQKTEEIKSHKFSKNYTYNSYSMNTIEEVEIQVNDLKSKVDGIVLRTFDSEKKKNLLTSFECLRELIIKTKCCLETMKNVSQLEESIIKLSNNFDKRSTELSNNIGHKNTQHDNILNITGFVASSAQDCIFGLRDNWDWVAESVRCSLIHLKNGADYHKFFHEVDECEHWMDCDLKKFKVTFDGKIDDAEYMIRQIDTVNTSLRQWEARVSRLWNESTKLLPIPMRVAPVATPCPGHVLADYETNEITVRNLEEILLLDNSQPDRWKIRNGKGQEGYVPPIIVIIPGPDQKCIDVADRLRLHLLATWTNLLKRVGVKLICYTLAVFQPDYSQKEINALKSMDDMDKEKLLNILTEVEVSLKKYWAEHEGFVNIQERISALRLILEEFGDDKSEEYSKTCQTLLGKITSLSHIIQTYQDLNKNWEKFKVSVETSKSPELMMIVDKWEQLQFVDKDYFAKFWKMKLPLDDQEKKLMNHRLFTLDGVQFEDTIDMAAQNSPRPQSANVSTIPQFTFTTPQIKLTSLDDKIQFKIGVPMHQHTHVDHVEQHHRENHITSATIISKPTFPTIRFTVDLHSGQGSPERSIHEETFEETRVFYSPNNGPNNGPHVVNNHHGYGESKVYESIYETRKNTQPNNAVDHLFTRVSNTSGLNESGYVMSRKNEMYEVTGTINNFATSNSPNTGRSFIYTNMNAAENPSQMTQDFGFDEAKVNKKTNFSEDSNDSTFLSSRQMSHIGADGAISPFPNDRCSSGDDSFSMGRVSGSDYEGTAFGIATETKTAETEQLSSAEMEENKTYVIGSVLNTADNSDISLKQSILLGIIRPSEGVYMDLKNNKRIPIATAMNDGLIRVVHCKTKRSQEKFSSIGIITIKTVREMLRPYTVVWVKDTKTQEELGPREASQRGILDEKQGYFIDKLTGESTMLVDAALKGFAKIEYSSDLVQAPEVVVKTYAVRAVVDRRLKKTVTFHDAVKRGIIDKESGAFKDTVTGEKMYVGDAIMRGFLKVRQIEDATGLNIDPQNKMIIDKTQKIKNKILKPLQVISAFKAAARRPGSASRPSSASGEKNPKM